MLILQGPTCIEGSRVQTYGPIWNNATGTLTPSKEPGTMLRDELLHVTHKF